MSGLFSAVGGTLENGMGTYVTNVSSALSSALVPAVTTAVTIWVLAYGLAVVRGEAHESVPAFAWRGLKLAIILAFALGTGIYQAQVVTAVNDVTAGLAQTIQSAAANTGAGNPGCGSVSGSSVTGSSAAGIYQTLDCYDQQIDLVMDAYFDQATHEGFSASGIVAGVGDFLCGLVAALGGSIFLMVLAFEVVMARMLLDLVLGLGPAFIACGAFGPTARFFEAWTAKVANYALLQVLVAAFLGMALTAFSSDLATFHVTTSAPGANAASLVANAQQRPDRCGHACLGTGPFRDRCVPRHGGLATAGGRLGPRWRRNAVGFRGIRRRSCLAPGGRWLHVCAALGTCRAAPGRCDRQPWPLRCWFRCWSRWRSRGKHRWYPGRQR